MKRRQFLKSALAGAGAAGLAACEGPKPPATSGGEGPAIIGKKVLWRMTSSFPRSLDTLFGGAERVAERVSAMTDGNFEIKVYPGGELVPGLEVLGAVQQGTVHAGQTASYYFIGLNPVLAFDACVPFGMTARQKTAWLLSGGGGELLNKAFSDFNIISFPCGNTGVQMGGWFKEEVKDLADLKGRKMRIPGMGGKVMDALGVNVQVLAGGEIYAALDRGAIDATEWVGPHDDEKLGFYKVAKNYLYPGWWEPGPNLSIYVNQPAWASLPVAYQEVFRTACHEVGQWMMARYDALNPPALQRLLAEGVKMQPFSDDIMVAARDASTQLLEELASKDAGYREVYEHWRKARNSYFSWFGAAEAAYAKFAFER